MNRHFATYKQVCGGLYHAMIRLPRDGCLKPICEKSGKPKTYPDALSAQEASTRALEAYYDGNTVHCGERVPAARAAAEKLFAKTKRRAVA